MNTFELQLLDYIQSAVRTMKAQPFVLNGRPGGFVGDLPQTRVQYDTEEAATNYTPLENPTIIDNLNHIRYRLAVVEGRETWVVGEDLSNQIIPSGVSYTTTFPIASGSLCLYVNGLRQLETDFSYTIGTETVTTAFVLFTDDTLTADYLLYSTFSGVPDVYSGEWSLEEWGYIWD